MAAVINPEIVVIARMIDQISSQAKAIGAALDEVKTKVKDIAPAVKDIEEPTAELGISFSRLALSLRMVSIGTAILRREIGVTNPFLDAMSKAILVTSSVATVSIASIKIMEAAMKAMAYVAAQGVVPSLIAAGAAVKAFGVAVWAALGPLIVIAAAAVAIERIAWYFGPAQTAARAFAGEIKNLEDAIKDAQTATENLRYEMMGLSIQDQILRIQELELRAAIEQRGFATQAELNTLAAITAHQREVNIEMAQGTLEQQKIERSAFRYKLQLQDIGAAIEALPTYALPGVYPEMEFPERPWRGPYGQMGFPPGGIRPAQIRGRMAGMVSVSISFPYATFASDIDVRSAVRAAGEDAAIELKRRL